MRSIPLTIALLLVTLLTCGLAGWHLADGNLSRLLGSQPPPVGQHLYTSFSADDVRKIQISSQGSNAEFAKEPRGWQMLQPSQDRMDPRAAIGIIGFTLGMRVEDLSLVNEVRLQEIGLDANATYIRLEGEDGRPLAKFRLGRRSPWLANDPESETPIPTLFVQPWDRNSKNHVYTCTGDILPLFSNNLQFLRDHHPFFFLPAALHKIRIQSPDGELTLGRDAPGEAWHIIKPLILNTDPTAIKTLIEGIHNLQASSVMDRSAVTLPTSGTSGTSQIALSFFGSETEAVLEIHPPENPETRDVLATVSDRPGTVFSLPLKPERNLVSLADLLLSVNDLRDPTLTNLNIASLREVSILPSTGSEIVITRTGPRLWTTMINGRNYQANEVRLFELLTAVTSNRVSGFESDAATDFSPWGLDRPFLKLTFTAVDSQKLSLQFGMDKNGGIFVNRLGTASVMRVDRALISNIAIHSYDWRHARLWSLTRPDLSSIERSIPQQPSLKLLYDFNNESWKAEIEGKDITDQMDPAKAEFLLAALETLEVTHWLPPADEDAAAALKTPALTLTVEERRVNDLGETVGTDRRELKFAPMPGSVPPQFYYGCLTSDGNPFLIDRAIFQKLSENPAAR